MTDTSVDLVHRYIEVINERDDARRRALLADLFTEDGSYIDQNLTAPLVGLEAINESMVEMQELAPDDYFSIISVLGSHNDMVLFTWRWATPGGAMSRATGTDTVLIRDGRIHRILGFIN
ncbi:nuclear transport factor 2 family protein [Streptomyces sp. SudanB182_2057]|uniref:nuclear transport factor 2 family protein n=1 Tax=Streptomyces sp. SudanB182_2057 TaxID=3035281 RepID=UPI003F55FF3C